MKYLQGKRNFDLVVCESDIPVPVNNQVLVKVLACGICGTDLHYLRSREEYTPLGHEISAIVVSQGNAVTKVSVGDMVVVEDAAPCGHCTYCKNNEHYLCRNTLGLNGQSGMGEYILVHENNLVLCKNLTREQATFVEMCIRDSYMTAQLIRFTYTIREKLKGIRKTTQSNGKAFFDSLEEGVYLCSATADIALEGYRYHSAPFLVFVPSGEGIYHVTVEPKSEWVGRPTEPPVENPGDAEEKPDPVPPRTDTQETRPDGVKTCLLYTSYQYYG